MTGNRTGDWSGALARARAHSPHLSSALARMPELADLLEAGDAEAALAYARTIAGGSHPPAIALRKEKAALSLALAIGDLAGAFTLRQVTGALSAFADRALDAAITAAIRRRAPDFEPGTQPAGFLALALGKHGAGELNYSSDIDPILLYDPALLPRRERDDPGEAAQRVARGVVETLSQVTEHGYVFRVDLRLRPASEVSPLAISIDGALTHYESSALTWERAAFIRARACAGDIAAGEDFLSAIRPFVWRKSLDFGAIAEIGRLTAQIRASTRTSEVGPGFDLKKGRGGIREIEFFAQTHQLIHGGRHPALRVRGTRDTLDALTVAGLIAADEARFLGESYDRLRTIEHRLQMVMDLQTHALPLDPAALDNVARLDGLADGKSLVAEVAEISDAVGQRYDALIAKCSPPPVPGQPVAMPSQTSLADELAQAGIADPEAAAERIAGWEGGRIRALRSDAARSAFAAIRPELLAALAAAPEPDRALVRFERLLDRLPSAINLFRLLEARPGLLQVLADIVSLAPPLADALATRADLLDPMIDASARELPGSVEELAARFGRFEGGDDYERKLDAVRRRVGEARFALGVRLVEGTGDPLDTGRALSRVAEAALQVLAAEAVAEFENVHGKVPGGELVVLGLGRFGGGLLTHASDLDLVFLFTGGFDTESDGDRPLGATRYFNRLAQRVIAALSVPTAEGALYEVDTRLRPSGEQGPLAVSLESFARYQAEQAWTWEHMALTRARPVFGSPAARAALAGTVHGVLSRPREKEKLRADVIDMRETMAAHKPPKGTLDVKLRRGGLVDLEFLVHHAQLCSGQGYDPDLEAAISLLASNGLLDRELAAAYAVLTRVLIAARLLAPDGALPPPAAGLALARACGYGDFDAVQAALAEAYDIVARGWRAAFAQDLETEQ